MSTTAPAATAPRKSRFGAPVSAPANITKPVQDDRLSKAQDVIAKLNKAPGFGSGGPASFGGSEMPPRNNYNNSHSGGFGGSSDRGHGGRGNYNSRPRSNYGGRDGGFGGRDRGGDRPQRSFAKPGCKLYVGNLSFDAKERDLIRLFEHYGDIQSIQVVDDKETGKNRGFAFVTFRSPDEAERALAASEQEVLGRKIRVNFAQEKRPPFGGDRGGFRGGRGGRGGRRDYGGRDRGGSPDYYDRNRGGRDRGRRDRDRDDRRGGDRERDYGRSSGGYGGRSGGYGGQGGYEQSGGYGGQQNHYGT
eukprot:UN25976